jgi:hypothetical protein
VPTCLADGALWARHLEKPAFNQSLQFWYLK